MRQIALNGKKAAGRVALVDDEDYELVSSYNWCIYYNQTAGPYAFGAPKGAGRGAKRILMHTLITGYKQTDHIDHDGLNNQRHNLRPATHAQNQWNQVSQAGRSGYRGVYWIERDQKWRANVRAHKKNYYLGQYETKEEAARVRDAAARELHGEFAVLNFPDEDPGGLWRYPILVSSPRKRTSRSLSGKLRRFRLRISQGSGKARRTANSSRLTTLGTGLSMR